MEHITQLLEEQHVKNVKKGMNYSKYKLSVQ